MQEFLIHDQVVLSFEMQNVGRVIQERTLTRIESVEEKENDDAERWGRVLFFNRCGPAAIYGIKSHAFSKVHTSWPELPDDPFAPKNVVKELGASHEGCCWMLERWEELRERLVEPGQFWQAPERLKAIRLLGCQPIEAAEDRRVAEIFVCSEAIETLPDSWKAFEGLLSDLGQPDLKIFVDRIRLRWPDLVKRGNKALCAEILLDLVDRNIERLNAKLEVFVEVVAANQAEIAQRQVTRLSFEYAKEGEQLRRHGARCRNAFQQGFKILERWKRKGKTGGGRRKWRKGRKVDGGRGTGGCGRPASSPVCARRRSAQMSEL
jgi:hypothetical protein